MIAFKEDQKGSKRVGENIEGWQLRKFKNGLKQLFLFG